MDNKKIKFVVICNGNCTEFNDKEKALYHGLRLELAGNSVRVYQREFAEGCLYDIMTCIYFTIVV